MKVLGIDPGPEKSALVVLVDGATVELARIFDNEDLIKLLRVRCEDPLCIEQITSMGQVVGASVFETVFWSGKFCEAYDPSGESVYRIPRTTVKLHLCNSMRVKDAGIRQVIIDRFGGRETAIGRKGSEGPLRGISSHMWAALGVALTWWDQNVKL